MQSTQGISLKVSSHQKKACDQISMEKQGIGKRQISLNLDNENYIINHKEISYKKYLYESGGSESYYPLVMTKTTYSSAGKPLLGFDK